MERQEELYKLPDDPFESPESLIASLMTINARNLSWTRDRIEEGLRSELAQVITEYRSVIHAVVKACSQEWAPNPIVILNLVEPQWERVERMYDNHCHDYEIMEG